MQRLQDDQAAHWCEMHGFQIGGGLPSARVSPTSGQAPRFRLTVPNRATDLVGLAYVILMSDTHASDDAFGGGILWLSRWEIGSEDIDRVGYSLLGSLTSQRDQAPTGDIAPGYLFDSADFADAHAAVSVPLLFQWDAHYIPAGGEFVVFMSNDGYLEILSRDAGSHERMVTRFRQAGWEPVQGDVVAQ